jgi:hypothetical protein
MLEPYVYLNTDRFQYKSDALTKVLSMCKRNNFWVILSFTHESVTSPVKGIPGRLTINELPA